MTIDPVLEQKLFDAYTAVINGESIRKAAKRFCTSRTTLTKYLYGERRNKVVAHEYEMRLDVAHEEELESYVATLTMLSLYVLKRGVYSLANQLVENAQEMNPNNRNSVSPLWIAKFFKRHPRLGHVKPVVFQKPRANDVYQEIIREWSVEFEKYIASNDISGSQLYCISETLYNVGPKKLSIVFDSLKNGELKPMKNDPDSFQYTIVETVCGSGQLYGPMVVLHGNTLEDLVMNHLSEVNSQALLDVVSSSNDDVLCDETYTNTCSQLSFTWLKRFDALTRAKHLKHDGSLETRVVVMNYNTCHITLDFLRYCKSNDIVPLFLLEYLSPVVQPVASILKSIHSSMIELFDRLYQENEKITNLDFLRCYNELRAAWLVNDGVLNEFEEMGLYPPNIKKLQESWTRKEGDYSETMDFVFRKTTPLLMSLSSSSASSIADDGELTDVTIYSERKDGEKFEGLLDSFEMGSSLGFFDF